MLLFGDYGKSKLHAEELIEDSGVPAIMLRIAPVYGFGSTWFTKIMDYMSSNRPLPRTDSQTQLVHISDAVRAVRLSLCKGAMAGTYIISDENPMKVSKIEGTISKALGIKPRFMPLWAAKTLAKISGSSSLLETLIGNRHYDISKANKFLEFKPKAIMENEIRKMVKQYLEEKQGYTLS